MPSIENIISHYFRFIANCNTENRKTKIPNLYQSAKAGNHEYMMIQIFSLFYTLRALKMEDVLLLI